MANKFLKIKPINRKKMGKKGRRATLIVVLAIYLIVLVALVIFQANRKSIDESVETFCYDDFDVFTSEQEAELNENCKYVQDKYGINVYISTCERVYGTATQWGTDFIYEHNMDYDENMVVIILNCQKINDLPYNYHFDIYTYGHAAKKITDSEINKLVWSSAGDDIVSTTDSSTETRVNGLKQLTIDSGVAYAWIYSDRWLIVIIITLVIGLIISLITVKSIKSSYSKKRDNNSFSYSANSNLNLTVKEDVYSHKYVTSVRISSSSSGGGGGGHSSGGGGGGGHRGGR